MIPSISMDNMWSFTKEREDLARRLTGRLLWLEDCWRDWRDCRGSKSYEEWKDWRLLWRLLRLAKNNMSLYLEFEIEKYDGWNIYFDDVFARDLLSRLPLPTLPAPIHPCSCCRPILKTPSFLGEIMDTPGLRTSAASCLIYEFLLRAIEPSSKYNGNRTLRGSRTELGLKLQSSGRREPSLRICREPRDVDKSVSMLPFGRPIPPESDSYARFALLRAWLQQCDKSHNCNKRRGKSKTALPTRVLYVGDPKDSGYTSDLVRLVSASEASRQEYVALSHCWGDPSVDEKKAYCTTQDNISQRLAGFSVSELPKTFQDAIEVTRELGILYLWIDSLCIIHYGDNGVDWKSEAGRMESVFSQAYCTIAATMAIDSYAGFLQRDISPEYIYVQDGIHEFYISTDVDDFEKDVGSAQLNTRAWVMQERVLARRTIHFSTNQTYWECGEGVCCENLARLHNSLGDKYFTLDSNFPSRLLKAGERRTLNCISFLFQDYSERNLTVPTDRAVAISGLVNRIAGALGCQSRYGVFQKYLHRNLLWQRNVTHEASTGRMKEIAYERYVPSWSWMAYSGGIKFLGIPLGAVDWFDHLRFDADCECDYAIVTNLWTFRNCTIEINGTRWEVLGPKREDRGWIQYDVEDGKDIREEQCVVVGRRTMSGIQKYYVLIVRTTSVDSEYRRVGIGVVQSDCVVEQRMNVRIV